MKHRHLMHLGALVVSTALCVCLWWIMASQFGGIDLRVLNRETVGRLVCRDTIELASSSPDQRYIAEVVKRNCGATVSWITTVRLRHRQDWFLSGRSRHVLIYLGLPPVSVAWKSNTVVEIVHACPAHSKDLLWEDVVIEYQKVDEGSVPQCVD